MVHVSRNSTTGGVCVLSQNKELIQILLVNQCLLKNCGKYQMKFVFEWHKICAKFHSKIFGTNRNELSGNDGPSVCE